MTRTNERRVRLGLWTLSWVASFFICTGPAATLAQAQSKAYVASTTANTVTVIDTASKTTGATIPVGLAPVQIVFSKDATRAYVANSGENTVSVINATDDTLLAPIAVGNPPASIAVSPDGATLYVLETNGDLESRNTSDGSVAAATLNVGTAGGNIAITPDGSFLYVASGDVAIVLTGALPQVQTRFTLDSSQNPDVFNHAVSVAISSTGVPYIGFTTYDFTNPILGFTATGGIRVLDPVNPATISLFALPGALSIAADDSLIFAGIDYFWANSLYGAAFFPGRIITTSDTASNQLVGFADLGADGALWNEQHTAAGLAVTPDRSTVFVAIPSKDWVGVVDVVSNVVSFLSVPGGPRAVAIAPDPSATASPLKVVAGDDVVTTPLTALMIGSAISNVLANDTLGGRPAAVGNVTSPRTVTPSDGITLDSAGAVWIAAGASVGPHTLRYEICEANHQSNCGQANVSLTVRDRYPITASGEAASAFQGATAIANVLSNDSFRGAVPDLTSVQFSQVTSSDPSIALDTANGSVSVAADAPLGDHWVSYAICEIGTTNCSDPAVRAVVTVNAHALVAANYTASVSRSGGMAVANVLANDTFDGGAVTLARVTLSQFSASDGLSLNTATGAVSVASGIAAGVQTLVYKICETASLSNCAAGTVTVNVTSFVINAVSDRTRASNKSASTPIANVLANDTLGGAPATLANVTLSLASAPPPLVQLDTTTGAVRLLGKVSGGSISFTYQICEIGNSTNCSRATVTLDLSGK